MRRGIESRDQKEIGRVVEFPNALFRDLVVVELVREDCLAGCRGLVHKTTGKSLRGYLSKHNTVKVANV